MSGKREIAAEVIKRMDGSVTKKDIERIVTLTFAIINDMTKKGERASVRGFGSFEVVERREKKGRDPQTGEDIIMSAHKKLVLKTKTKKGVRR